MSFSSQLDVHDELSGAAVGRAHRIIGVLLTLITMFAKVPTFELDGVPLNCPVVALKEAHAGRPVMENVRVLLPGSEAEGWKA